MLQGSRAITIREFAPVCVSLRVLFVYASIVDYAKRNIIMIWSRSRAAGDHPGAIYAGTYHNHLERLVSRCGYSVVFIPIKKLASDVSPTVVLGMCLFRVSRAFSISRRSRILKPDLAAAH
ncbi:hypothetical protein EVAR_13070_1 [Eumeta japonica]|uniref:Uncharacterized protein n=1 Tax=Eumeta variegata TaxID=151549 RepID=A0A4C2A8I7_EUMVA|nr:hypothetical protein EVAR_13070_1 [Eumeta japonica]